MKEDITKELSITDCLTRVSSKVATLSQHYSGLEEKLLEVFLLRRISIYSIKRIKLHFSIC